MRSLGRQQHFVNDSLSSKIPDRGLVSNCPKLVDYIGELGEASGFVMAFFFLNWCRFERTSTNPLKRLRSVQGSKLSPGETALLDNAKKNEVPDAN